ncbi:MAG: DUF3971 domain-containing protein [Alphaproteobacteria bacterium]|nr:DUF3971 domain-containing protein [Alphaproteobacteria bacterium]
MKRMRALFGKTGLLVIEALAVLGVLAALLLGVAMWRLQQGPIDLNFARDYIAQALEDPDSGIEAQIGNAALYWPDPAGPLFVGVQNLLLTNDQGQKIIEIGEASIGLSRSRLLIGRIAPTALIIKKPGLRIIRREDNTLDFGFAGNSAPSTPSDDTGILDKLIQFVAHPGDEAAQNSRFYRLRALDIEDATIMVEDHVLGVSWFAPWPFNLSLKSNRQGLEAYFDFALPGAGEKPSDIQVNANYAWESKSLDFSLDFEDFNLQFLTSRLPELGPLSQTSLPISGTIDGTFEKETGLSTLHAALKAASGAMRIPAVRPEPLGYKDLDIDISYDKKKGNLELTSASLTLEDIPLKAHGAFTVALDDTDQPQKIDGALEAIIPALEHPQIVTLWPEVLKEDSSREWIVDKIKTGYYTNLSAKADMAFNKTDEGWQFDISSLLGGFDFEGGTVDYRAPLHQLEDGKGSGLFDLGKDTLTIKVESGKIGDIAVESAELLFTEVIADGKGGVIINTKTKGPLKTYLEYAGKDPINLTDSLSFDIEKVKGDTVMEAMLDFPTRKDVKLSEFKIDISGTINDIFIPALIGQADLTGGPLTIKANHETALIEGSALLGGQAMTVKREGFLRSEGKPYKNKTTAKITTTPELRTALGIDVSDFIDNTAIVNLSQTEYAGGKTTADITADLTQARIMIEPFGYEKLPGVKGSLKTSAILQDDKLRELKDFTVEAEHLKIEPSQLTFTETDGEVTVQSAVMPQFFVNETLANLSMERAGKQMKIILNGKFLDARALLKDDKKPDAEPKTPMLISVSVDQMRTADDQTVQYAKIYADINAEGAFDQFEVDAIAGAGDVYLRYKPDEQGERSFHFEADDAGAALKAFGVYDNIVDGTISVHARPVDGPQSRNLSGTATLNNFKVVKAPALARLLGAMSVPGLLELLGNDGLVFSKLESGFTWNYKQAGSLLTLKDGRTSGNSLGLTFDGTINRGTDIMDLKGTIIPLSTMNKIVGSIPLIGDLITGGTGSVFAATYTMRGETEDPDVSVNPLSVLTPGILRRILFE